MYLKEQKNECWDRYKELQLGYHIHHKTLLIVYCMGELLPVLFKCILKEILSLLSIDETVENLKFPFSI